MVFSGAADNNMPTGFVNRAALLNALYHFKPLPGTRMEDCTGIAGQDRYPSDQKSSSQWRSLFRSEQLAGKLQFLFVRKIPVECFDIFVIDIVGTGRLIDPCYVAEISRNQLLAEEEG